MMKQAQRKGCILAMVVMLATGVAAQAQTETVLFSFRGRTSGLAPTAGLIRDEAGNLYGTTWKDGVVFKLSPAGEETVLHRFSGGADVPGLVYGSRLARDAEGNLYGTRGDSIFRLDGGGKETILHTFASGATPQGGLMVDAAGNLYGTTLYGGNLSACGGLGCGMVFKLDGRGRETVLYAFTYDLKGSLTDGANPNCCLVGDEAGNLYGTTNSGGASYSGTVFQLRSGGGETILYSFRGGSDGAGPVGGLVRDGAGNLYGTTSEGGECGAGTVFRINASGQETVLYSFTGGADGGTPNGGLVRDAGGNLYGSTLSGGAGGAGGVVFRLDPGNRESVLYSFRCGADGCLPVGTPVLDAAGNLYGATMSGGRVCDGYTSCGVVYKLAPGSGEGAAR